MIEWFIYDVISSGIILTSHFLFKEGILLIPYINYFLDDSVGMKHVSFYKERRFITVYDNITLFQFIL